MISRDKDIATGTGMLLYSLATLSLAGAWTHWPHVIAMYFSWAGLSLMTHERSFKSQLWLCNAFFLAVPWLVKVVA